MKLKNEIIVGEKTLEEIATEIASRSRKGFVPTRKFDGRDLQAAVLNSADLRGVSLDNAVMHGADLGGAQLQGADLSGAQLHGAYLNGAQLQGANLNEAQLQGANLIVAQLQGADLNGAQLQGANLNEAQLQVANLIVAQLQGADLNGAQLQGADLNGAQLQGADLNGAQLQGADLSGAQLQGANLNGAQLQGAEFYETFVFRTGVTDANVSTLSILSADPVRLSEPFNPFPFTSEPLTPGDVDKWSAAAMEFVERNGNDIAQRDIAQRFARLKPGFQTPQQDAADQAMWSGWQQASLALDPTGAQHRRRLATILGDLACEVSGEPYVARALFAQASWRALGGVRDRIKDGRKNPETCPGVAGFSADDWRIVDAIKPAHD